MKRPSHIAVALAVTVLGSATFSFAHHAANVMFDLGSPVITVQGLLTRYANVNPHTRLEFEAAGGDGKVVRWSVDAPSPAGMRTLGVNAKDDMAVGKTYTFRVIRARDGSDRGLLLGMVLPDGRQITIRLTPAERGERTSRS